MKHLLKIFFFIFSLLQVIASKAQFNIQVSAGLVNDRNLNASIPRATVGINNLYSFSLRRISKEAAAVLCNGEERPLFELGMYYTYEHKNGIYFQEDQTNYYTRDLLGLKLKFPNHFYIYSGAGLFQKGILTTDRGNKLRKELGIGFQFPSIPLTIDGSISNVIGNSFNIGYVVQIGQFRKD